MKCVRVFVCARRRDAEVRDRSVGEPSERDGGGSIGLHWSGAVLLRSGALSALPVFRPACG